MLDLARCCTCWVWQYWGAGLTAGRLGSTRFNAALPLCTPVEWPMLTNTDQWIILNNTDQYWPIPTNTDQHWPVMRSIKRDWLPADAPVSPLQLAKQGLWVPNSPQHLKIIFLPPPCHLILQLAKQGLWVPNSPQSAQNYILTTTLSPYFAGGQARTLGPNSPQLARIFNFPIKPPYHQ